MKWATMDDIVKLLKKAASIKDKVEPICNPNIMYYKGKKIGRVPCPKCYPNYSQPERSKRKDSCNEFHCKRCGALNTIR